MLVAGSGEMVLDWAPLLPLLAPRYRIVGYDRAGSGASDPLPTLTLAAELADLAALLDVVGPAVLIGHSWGGLLVQLAAMHHPASVRGLVLVDASHERVLTGVPRRLLLAERLMGTGVMLAHRLGRFGKLATAAGCRLAEASTTDPDVQRRLTDAYVASYAHTHQVAMIRDEARVADRATVQIAASRAENPLPDVPLIALSATRKPASARRLSLPATAEVVASVPRGEHRVVAGSGHYIHHDAPPAVATAIADVTHRAG